MITLILSIHLALAAGYSFSVIGLTIAAAIRKSVPIVKSAAIGSFGATVGTGLVLVVVSPKAMATFCTSTLIASVFGVVALSLYKHRVAAFSSL